MNPCPCGYYGDPTKEYTCAPSMVTRYQKRTSEAGPVGQRPLLDRIDIHVKVPRVPASREKLTGARLGESSSVVSARVEAAQGLRFAPTARASRRTTPLYPTPLYPTPLYPTPLYPTPASCATPTRKAARRCVRARSVQARRDRSIAHADGDVERATATLCPRVSSRAKRQDRANDCRSHRE